MANAATASKAGTSARVKPGTPTWSAEEAATVRRLWADGLSAAEIGRILGRSRNAVIGRVHRDRLNDELIGSRKRPRIERLRPKPMPPKPRRETEPAQHRPGLAYPEPLNVSLLAIGAGECRRVIGETAAEKTLFCGRPTGSPKRSFCEGCAAKLFQARPNWEERPKRRKR